MESSEFLESHLSQTFNPLILLTIRSSHLDKDLLNFSIL